MPQARLNAAAKLLVYSSIIAGDSNSQIRQKLYDAGYPAAISDSALSHYRSAPVVVSSLQRKEQEAIQAGLSQRAERILALTTTAKKLERELSDLSEPTAFLFRHRPAGEIAALVREYRGCLKDIGDLVDPAKPQPLTLQHVDMSKLSDDQLNDIARGVPIEFVLASGRTGGSGTRKETPGDTGDDER